MRRTCGVKDGPRIIYHPREKQQRVMGQRDATLSGVNDTHAQPCASKNEPALCRLPGVSAGLAELVKALPPGGRSDSTYHPAGEAGQKHRLSDKHGTQGSENYGICTTM